VFLALAFCGGVLLAGARVLGAGFGIGTAAVVAVLLASAWFLAPLRRRTRIERGSARVSTAASAGSAPCVKPLAIDWDGANVHDGTLEVELTAAPGRGWAARFRRAVALLDRVSGEWGAVSLRRGRVTVVEVREGGEPRLRHLLDSAVVQANGAPGSDAPADADPLADQRARDRRTTDAFRAPSGAAGAATAEVAGAAARSG
jgi:hypothetical protein